MKTYKKAFTGVVMSILFTVNLLPTYGQKADQEIDEAGKAAVINKVLSILKDKYIFPGKVPVIQKAITASLATGVYQKTGTAEQFLKKLNEDLELLSNDRHVNVFFDPLMVKQIEISARDSSTAVTISPQYMERAKFENFMIRNVERLDGNVGYFKFNRFFELEISKQSLASAMNLLINSSALIIDLRQNGGGHSITTNFLMSYFLPDSTLIGEFTSRVDNTTKKIYTEHDPLIRKFPADIPLFILTSKRTSSAAEGFAYALQAFGRATIVGDTTNGEANPGYLFPVNKEMFVMVPAFINRNIITNTNWQGIGVIPDIRVNSDKALLMAQVLAYKNLAASTQVDDLKRFYEWKWTGINAEVNPIKIAVEDLKTFAGNYADDRTITVEQGELYYQRVGGSPRKKLLPLAADTFVLEGSSFFRVRFIRDNKGNTAALEGMYDDGKNEISKKLE